MPGIVMNIGYTAFHYACSRGWSEIVDMMIKHTEPLKLDFEVKSEFSGYTAFQIAELKRNHEIVDLIKKKLPAGTF